MDWGEYDRAEDLYREALRIRLTLHSEKHYDVVFTKAALSTILRDNGKLDEAESMLNDAVVGYRNLLEPDHYTIGRTLSDLGFVLEQQNRLDEAEARYREALNILEHNVPNPQFLTTARWRLGLLLARRNEFDEAFVLLLCCFTAL